MKGTFKIKQEIISHRQNERGTEIIMEAMTGVFTPNSSVL